jgi:hypothetical protein
MTQSERLRGTHVLESTERSQNTKTNRASKGYAPAGEHRGMGKIRRNNRASDRHSLPVERRGWNKSGHGTNRASDRHSLSESASGGVTRGTETNRTNEGYSLPGERIRKDKSVHADKQSERRVHTNWRSQREAQVTTRNQIEKKRGTHGLESGEGGTSQDTETN